MEVLVALSLAALVVLLAHRLFTGVADGASRLEHARQALDRTANARRWLVEAFGSLDVGSPEGSFAGHPDLVEFTSWELTPGGWLTRRRLSLRRSGDRFLARIGGVDSLLLADSVRDLQFDYLLETGDGNESAGAMPGANAHFVREWISPMSAPLAVRLRLAFLRGSVDTLFLIVGPRG